MTVMYVNNHEILYFFLMINFKDLIVKSFINVLNNFLFRFIVAIVNSSSLLLENILIKINTTNKKKVLLFFFF